jgi:hypothetical protein
LYTPVTRTPITQAHGHALIQLTAMQLVSVVGCAAVTAGGAVSAVFASGFALEALLICAVIAGATGSVSLLALGRSARAKHIEEQIREIDGQCAALQESGRAASLLTHEMLDIMRSMVASRGAGGDTGPQPTYVHR